MTHAFKQSIFSPSPARSMEPMEPLTFRDRDGAPAAAERDHKSDYSACYDCAACFAQSCDLHASGGDSRCSSGNRSAALDGADSQDPAGERQQQQRQRVADGVDGGGGAGDRKPLFVQAFWRNGPGRGARDDAGDADDARRRLRQRLAPSACGHACGPACGHACEPTDASTPNKHTLIFVFFHGNYFAHELYQDALTAVREHSPHGMLTVELRGYGEGSSSSSSTSSLSSALQKASEESVYEDGRAAMRFLLHEKFGLTQKNIVLCGYSMGTAVAVQMAVEFPDVHSVLLFAPIKSMPDAGHFHTRLPLSFLETWVNNRFENDLKISEIRAPIIMVHGRRDEVLPLWHAEYLYAHAVNAPCRALFITDDIHAPKNWTELWRHILAIYLPKKQ